MLLFLCHTRTLHMGFHGQMFCWLYWNLLSAIKQLHLSWCRKSGKEESLLQRWLFTYLFWCMCWLKQKTVQKRTQKVTGAAREALDGTPVRWGNGTGPKVNKKVHLRKRPQGTCGPGIPAITAKRLCLFGFAVQVARRKRRRNTMLIKSLPPGLVAGLAKPQRPRLSFQRSLLPRAASVQVATPTAPRRQAHPNCSSGEFSLRLIVLQGTFLQLKARLACPALSTNVCCWLPGVKKQDTHLLGP